MELNIRNAAKLFFPNPSFEMIYFEAVRNSIDANATKVNIDVNLNSFPDHKSLKIQISDNGDGFTERNFEKFKKLLEVEEEDHKGLGRLVYLNYFNTVNIKSDFKQNDETKTRKFVFDEKFKGESKIDKWTSKSNETVLNFSDFRQSKIYQYDSVRTISTKEELLSHFYPLFYRLKVEQKELTINITVVTKTPNPDQNFISDKRQINVQDLPNLIEVSLDENIDLLTEMKLHYSIKKSSNLYQKFSVVTAICVDERTVKVDIISKSGIPEGYDIIFILYSNFFTGKVDTSRQNLTIDNNTLTAAKKVFGNKVAEILNKEIPTIKEKNKAITKELAEIYPHLQGLFDETPVGL